MKQEEFAYLSELMATDLIQSINKSVEKLQVLHGDDALSCFGAAFALASSSTLFAYCIGSNLSKRTRKEVYRLYNEALKESFKRCEEYVINAVKANSH